MTPSLNLKKGAFQSAFPARHRQLETPRGLREARRDIARIKTIARRSAAAKK